MYLIKKLTISLAVLFSLTGCHWATYKIDVDQGNIVDKQALNKLQPGMTKEQVKRIIGTPLLADMFHDDRWDYIQYYRSGYTQKEQEGKVSIYFDNGLLISIKTDEFVDIQPEELPYGILAD